MELIWLYNQNYQRSWRLKTKVIRTFKSHFNKKFIQKMHSAFATRQWQRCEIWHTAKKITTTTAKPSTTTLYYYFILLKFYAEMSYNNALRKSLSVIGMHRIFWHFGQHDANSKFAKKPKMMLFKVHRLQ